jgi:hypothetical protein
MASSGRGLVREAPAPFGDAHAHVGVQKKINVGIWETGTSGPIDAGEGGF